MVSGWSRPSKHLQEMFDRGVRLAVESGRPVAYVAALPFRYKPLGRAALVQRALSVESSDRLGEGRSGGLVRIEN
jgi:hypothetical protein